MPERLAERSTRGDGSAARLGGPVLRRHARTGAAANDQAWRAAAPDVAH